MTEGTGWGDPGSGYPTAPPVRPAPPSPSAVNPGWPAPLQTRASAPLPQADPMRARRGCTVGLVGFGVLLVGFLVWGVVATASHTHDDPFKPPKGAVAVSSANLLVDQCFVDLGRLYVVPCSKSHTGEVFDVEVRPDGPSAPWPGRHALDASTAASRAAFRAYVGIDARQSKLSVYLYVPSEVRWDEGERRIVRFLMAPDLGNHKGSLRDSHR